MPPTLYKSLEVRSCNKKGYVKSLEGTLLQIPASWSLLPPGDAALSRRIKKCHDHWIVKEPKGKRSFSKGILSDTKTLALLKKELEAEREDPSYEKKLQAGRERRAKQEGIYREEFRAAIIQFLSFHSHHGALAQTLSERITAHAIPVGSGTVARTKTIPIENRAEAATIAWMRHQTTAYDSMTIVRKKGARRETRRKLASHSRKILDRYRSETQPSSLDTCPLYQAIQKPSSPS